MKKQSTAQITTCEPRSFLQLSDVDQLQSNQLGSISSDHSNSKLKEQQIMAILSFLTEKDIVFPKIFNYLTFQESKQAIVIKKGNSLLKQLLKVYNFDVIQEFANEEKEVKEQELIQKILDVYLTKISIIPIDEAAINNQFYSFYYKLADLHYSLQNNKNEQNLDQIAQIRIQNNYNTLTQISEKIPQLNIIQQDYKLFVYFKAQLLYIGYAIDQRIPIPGLLECTRASLNQKNQKFEIEFDISNKVFLNLYSQRKLSNFNFLFKIDQLITLDRLTLTEMHNYLEKVFPSYEYLLVDNNYNFFLNNLDLLLERKHLLISELKESVSQSKFQSLFKELAQFRFTSIQADILYEKLNLLIKYITINGNQIFDITPVNIPSFIRNSFYKTYEKKDLFPQQQVEAMLIITKVLTEMIKYKFPFPPLLSHLNLDNPDDTNLLNITKELIIECQSNKIFNLFFALTHYNFQNLARSQTYSKAFYQQQLAQQEFEQPEIVIRMLKIIVYNEVILKNEIAKSLSDQDTRLNLWSYITVPRNQISEYNSHYREIMVLLKQILQQYQGQVIENNIEKEQDLTLQIKQKIEQISYLVTQQPYQERRLGRPPGFYQAKCYSDKKQRLQNSEKYSKEGNISYSDQKQRVINYEEQFKQIRDGSPDDLILIEKQPKLNSEQKFQKGLQSFLD